MEIEMINEALESIPGVEVVPHQVFKNYYHVNVNGLNLMNIKPKDNQITVFPLLKYFGCTKLLTVDAPGLAELVRKKAEEFKDEINMTARLSNITRL